jgi:hypothetical protein
MSWLNQLPACICMCTCDTSPVGSAGASGGDQCCYVATGWARITGIHAQHVEHIPAAAKQPRRQQWTSFESHTPAAAIAGCRLSPMSWLGSAPTACCTHLKLRPTALTASATCPAAGASRPLTGTATRLESEPRGSGLWCTGSSGARLQQQAHWKRERSLFHCEPCSLVHSPSYAA